MRITVSALLIPWSVFRDRPILLTSADGRVTLLPVFMSRDDLWRAMDWIRPEEAVEIRRAEDNAHFLDSIPLDVHVAINPQIIDGNTRWDEVRFDAIQESGCEGVLVPQ